MRVSTKISTLITGASTLALLAGCSGGGTGLTSPADGSNGASLTNVTRSHSIIHRVPANSHRIALPGLTPLRSIEAVHPFVDSIALATAPKKIVISDADNNVVNVYSPSGKHLAQLGGFSEPQGLTTDLHGNLYVADTSNSRVQVFAQGFKGTPTTLPVPGQYPVGVDSFGQGAYVAVTNMISTSGGDGSISIFKGSTLVSTISNPTLARAYFCAFDAKGDLFVDGSDTSDVVVLGEIANATSGGTTLTILTYDNTILFPGGVQVDDSGNIAVADQEGSAIYTYAPPSGGSLGSPIATTPLTGGGDPVTFAFTKPGTDLYTADAVLIASQEFAYPVGGSPVSTIDSGGQPIGVAIIGAQTPGSIVNRR